MLFAFNITHVGAVSNRYVPKGQKIWVSTQHIDNLSTPKLHMIYQLLESLKYQVHFVQIHHLRQTYQARPIHLQPHFEK